MASTYSPNLRLELIGTGEQQGTWGATTNTNLGTLLEEAIGGYTSVTVSDVGDTTLTTNNGSADQSRNMTLNLTGALTNTRNVICPAIEKLYVVKNATTGSQAVVFKVSGQTGVTIPNGATVFVYVDGTDARSITGSIATQASNNVSITGGSITGITDLAVADGGTGASNASSARTNLGIGTLGTQNSNAVSITGGTIVSNASGFAIRDADASNVLTFAVGSNLTANTTLTLTTGASTNRTLDISASNVTITAAGAAILDDADASAQRTTLGVPYASTTEVLTGTEAAKVATPDAIAALWEQGSNVASSGTVSLGEGGYFNITGTTTITDIDFATDKAGRTAWVRFTGALTLTHNASTLILPGGANITTAAGDTACFVSEGTDVVRCVSYTKASGQPVVESSGIKFIAAGAGTGTAGVQFTNIPQYTSLLLIIFMGTQTNPTMRLALSSNNGSSYGTARTISSSVGDTFEVTFVTVSDTKNNGANKTISPFSAYGKVATNITADGTYTTTATETVVTGIIDALDVDSSASSTSYSVLLLGIP